MATKLITLKISKKRWARGGINGRARLLNDKGNMCCLGFACRRLGLKACEINDYSLPFRVPDEDKKQPGHPLWKSSDEIQFATGTNDDYQINDTTRIRKLKPILKRLGFRAVFVP